MVGFIDRVPAMNDRRREGPMIVDLDAINGWLNGTPAWSFPNGDLAGGGSTGAVDQDRRPDATVRLINAQFLPGDEADEIVRLAKEEASSPADPCRSGLVAILFVGAHRRSCWLWPASPGTCCWRWRARAREMGVLRALGFPRSGVAATFAVEQVVVLGSRSRDRYLRWHCSDVDDDPVPPTRGDGQPISSRQFCSRCNWAVLLGYIAVVECVADLLGRVGDPPGVGAADERSTAGGGALMARIIECDNLIKIHKQGNLEVVALQGLDFAMDEGEFISIVGKSGAGKSTLLQILAGLETPSAGRVEVAGTDLTDLTVRSNGSPTTGAASGSCGRTSPATCCRT